MTTIERRSHKRFSVPGRTIAITPHNLGQILDISKSGCAIKYIGDDIQIGAKEYIDILMKHSKDQSFYVEKVPTSIVWESSPDFSAYSSIVVKRVGIEFKDLDLQQSNKLNDFIKHLGEPAIS